MATKYSGEFASESVVEDEHNPCTVSSDSIYISSDDLARLSLNGIGYKESDEMTKNVEYVYIPYAINQRTKETWEGDRMTGKDYTATLQRAILDNAYNINMLGDSDDIYVWLGKVGEFEPIE